ncbi:MAG: TRAP transporter small permease [Granulosicoccus sp.]
MSGWSSIFPKVEGAGASYNWLLRLATCSGALGGVVILSVATIVTVSIVMRNTGLRGISGDFELVEMSCVFAAGLFLPLCQLKKGHVMVDLFTSWLPQPLIRSMDRFWTLLFAVAWLCLFFYMFTGMQEIREYGDRSMLLKVPMWWAFLPSILGVGLSGLIALAQVFLWHDNAALMKKS